MGLFGTFIAHTFLIKNNNNQILYHFDESCWGDPVASLVDLSTYLR